MSKQKIVRIYPIRTNKNRYTIQIYSENDTHVSKSSIHLAGYNVAKPLTQTGKLYNPEHCVIKDNYFSVKISFPLLYPFTVNICNTERMMTMNKLIHIIKEIYKYAYKQEEETASEKTFEIKKKCFSCFGKKDVKNLPECDIGECCICNDSVDKLVKLHCNHTFHHNCIQTWIQKSNTCPLCRQTVHTCDQCNSKGYKIIEYTGKIIPLELRDSMLYRNTTNGIFGIYDFDFEDLYLNHMEYNRKEKLLKLNIVL